MKKFLLTVTCLVFAFAAWSQFTPPSGGGSGGSFAGNPSQFMTNALHQVSLALGLSTTNETLYNAHIVSGSVGTLIITNGQIENNLYVGGEAYANNEDVTNNLTAGEFFGNAAGETNIPGPEIADTWLSNSFVLTGTNATIPFIQGGAIYEVVVTNLIISNLTGLGAGYNHMTIFLKSTNTFLMSWLPNVNRNGSFTTNWVPLTNSLGWWVLAVACQGTNWEASTCSYALSPPNT